MITTINNWQGLSCSLFSFAFLSLRRARAQSFGSRGTTRTAPAPNIISAGPVTMFRDHARLKIKLNVAIIFDLRIEWTAARERWRRDRERHFCWTSCYRKNNVHVIWKQLLSKPIDSAAFWAWTETWKLSKMRRRSERGRGQNSPFFEVKNRWASVESVLASSLASCRTNMKGIPLFVLRA